MTKPKCEHWGNPCERHDNVAAWVAQVKIDEEGLHCFGCFIESREKQAQRVGFKRAKEIAVEHAPQSGGPTDTRRLWLRVAAMDIADAIDDEAEK